MATINNQGSSVDNYKNNVISSIPKILSLHIDQHSQRKLKSILNTIDYIAPEIIYSIHLRYIDVINEIKSNIVASDRQYLDEIYNEIISSFNSIHQRS